MTTLTIFAKDMRAISGNVQRKMIELQRTVAIRVVENVATATPVLTGQAAGNWKTEVNGFASNWDMGPNSPTTSIANAVSALGGLRNNQVINITNNVPYIIELNNGSSAKAPAAYVETAVLNALTIMNRFNLLTP
jgi:hypothetical protein